MKKMMLLLLGTLSLAGFAADDAWLTDFEQAKKLAAESGKYILINFTGSDWCGWCKRLDQEVFSQSEFTTFAADNLILLKLDFPRYRQQSQAERQRNMALAQEFRVQGFPTLFLTDANGKPVLQTGYQPGGPQPFNQLLKSKMR